MRQYTNKVGNKKEVEIDTYINTIIKLTMKNYTTIKWTNVRNKIYRKIKSPQNKSGWDEDTQKTDYQ